LVQLLWIYSLEHRQLLERAVMPLGQQSQLGELLLQEQQAEAVVILVAFVVVVVSKLEALQHELPASQHLLY
jgi:hypothetical protein